MSGALCWHPHHRIRGRHHRSSSGFKRCFNLVSTLECTRASTWLWRSRWTQRTRMTPSPPGLLSSSSAGFPESWPSSTWSPATSTVFTIQWSFCLILKILIEANFMRCWHIFLLWFFISKGTSFSSLMSLLMWTSERFVSSLLSRMNSLDHHEVIS